MPLPLRRPQHDVPAGRAQHIKVDADGYVRLGRAPGPQRGDVAAELSELQLHAEGGLPPAVPRRWVVGDRLLPAERAA